MFTGLVERTGKLLAKHLSGGNARLTIGTDNAWTDLAVGESVAVNGICLTLTAFGPNQLEFDVMPETIDRTAFKNYRTGDIVNVERALRLGDRLGGHFVLGHVDTSGTVREMKQDSAGCRLRIAADPSWLKYVVAKGSIAIDGISLTVSAVNAADFEVALIPTTLKQTNLARRRSGDSVNLEFDYLAKLTEKLLNRNTGLTVEKLRDYGFDGGGK